MNVIITGSARGLGFEMAKNFRKHGFDVVLSDINEERLKAAAEKLEHEVGTGRIVYFTCNVTKIEEVENLYAEAEKALGPIQFWINNAGCNQPTKHAWDLSMEEINTLLEVDLKGAIQGTNVAFRHMNHQGFGAIYNVEGFGSNDAYQEYLVMYGTAKRAVTYFTTAFAKEAALTKSNVIIGKLSPGIMITDFLTSSVGKDKSVELSDKVKKVYNILGDYPDVVAAFFVNKMIQNKKNNTRIAWLTNGKAFRRFMLAGINKRDFFKK
jgi:NAD(P)-dependent dehydrogenase (short-subunit alcohol dehydrogenase family)